MEIKNGKKIVITGKTICLIAGTICEICAAYWLAQSLLYDNTNLPALLSTVFIGLFLVMYGRKR